MREYELTIIIQPEMSEEGSQGIFDKVDKIFESHGSTRLLCDDLGKRKLAYEIANFHKGHYYILYFLDEGKAASDIERVLRMDESVLRFMTILATEEVADVEARIAEAREREIELAKRAAERAAREAEEAKARAEAETRAAEEAAAKAEADAAAAVVAAEAAKAEAAAAEAATAEAATDAEPAEGAEAPSESSDEAPAAAADDSETKGEG